MFKYFENAFIGDGSCECVSTTNITIDRMKLALIFTMLVNVVNYETTRPFDNSSVQCHCMRVTCTCYTHTYEWYDFMVCSVLWCALYAGVSFTWPISKKKNISLTYTHYTHSPPTPMRIDYFIPLCVAYTNVRVTATRVVYTFAVSKQQFFFIIICAL